MSSSILFLLPYPLHQAPSQRFRIEAYFQTLKGAGFTYRTHSFLSRDAWNVAPKYDYIVVHREAAPLGPPIFEWILSKLFRKRIIYDFDDAIWIPNTTVTNRAAAWAKCFWKVKSICRWAYKVSAGNAYLATYANTCNDNVVINPTCVDMLGRYNRSVKQNNQVITIGWTGSHSTLFYLELVYPILQSLHNQYAFRFLIICDQPPRVDLPFIEFRTWSETTEIDDLLQLNIGLMPLEQDAWSEGKCGFKIIQYLSLGIPAVASPVGVNKDIVEHGINGFLCQSPDEWRTALSQLLTDEKLRTDMGAAGRSKMNQKYSVQSNENNFLSLFS